MASSTILPYSSTHYNTLPEFFTAKETFKAKNASKTIDITLASLFLRHKVHHNLGVQMLHTHFTIGDDERLVGIGAVAVPIELDIIVGSAIKPLVYRFVPTGVAVCEWTQGNDANEVDLSSPQYAAFMAELRIVLDEAGLIDVLGIFVRQPGDGKMKGVEFTAGRANITLHKDEPTEGGNSVEASWVFMEKTVQPGDATTRTMSACNSWCQPFVGNHSSRHKEKGGRYSLDRETQGASLKDPNPPVELAAPIDTSDAITATEVMAARKSWSQEFVGNHSSRHQEKGGRSALEAEMQGDLDEDEDEDEELVEPVTQVMAVCTAWCREFVGNHSSRHKEKGG
ncbi:hypothetical protein VE01_02895 [Pseudogymnoascus verrucosus]|uniref:Uncharacterized protein n=1 Tax=Pseudogymnoascus verrucosus TaxID=342668 RepID=A0A1B8GUS9_9PEZI|nr:uncharacterized protein VE01_02895 [Pseudogymnoascus verrucosus]OBT99593.1 hypothetical protein VE01_02895 [Pseudogymnoascus verrucosus]